MDNSVLNGVWVKNPIQNNLEIYTSYNLENATVKVTGVLGKTIATFDNLSINQRIELPVTLQSGMYMVTIKTDNGIITKKVIKE
jgi:hypothetical protein